MPIYWTGNVNSSRIKRILDQLTWVKKLKTVFMGFRTSYRSPRKPKIIFRLNGRVEAIQFQCEYRPNICFHLCNFDWLNSSPHNCRKPVGYSRADAHTAENALTAANMHELAGTAQRRPYGQFLNELIHFLHDKLWLVIMNFVGVSPRVSMPRWMRAQRHIKYVRRAAKCLITSLWPRRLAHK